MARDNNKGETLIEVENLTVHFVSREITVYAVNGVNFTLKAGEVLCILGESGSGKSVTLRSLMWLLPEGKTQIAGQINVVGHDILGLNRRALSHLRGDKIAMIFQEPMTALDPVYTIGHQIAETIVQHKGTSYDAARKRALELLQMVQIPSPRRRLRAYPHELSGGLRQRAMIAMALSCEPSVLLADEPTTALDASVQIQILLLLRSLQEEIGMGIIFVTHDLGVASEVADRVAVMYAGRFVEVGLVRDIVHHPMHPYTQGLLGSTVRGAQRNQRLTTIPGSPPNMENLPHGCSFAPRCPHAEDRCMEAVPAEIEIGPEWVARCIKIPAWLDFAKP